jgi:hypothetical protein
MRFEVFMAVKIGIVVFWLTTLCTLVGSCETTWHHISEDHIPRLYNLKLENIPKKIYHCVSVTVKHPAYCSG